MTLTSFYRIDCPQSYPTIAWGQIIGGDYDGRYSVLISNTYANTFTEKVSAANIEIIECKSMFCPHTDPNWGYNVGPKEYVALLYNFMGLYWFAQANVPEVLTGSPPISDSFQIFTEGYSISHMDMTNGSLYNFPYIFYCTSGENPSFYQKDESTLWTDTDFVERSTSLPSSEITIIKADDAT
jgi:hypothetical protein